jgi:hypothetical protein
MWVGGGPTGAFDYHARARVNKLEADLRALTKQVAELTAALKARDEADYKHLELAGERT